MSDSMNRPPGLIVGTAGHIDHGKTSLIGSLTGIDTDRLAEEKRRGISIDLGFAHLALPNGVTVGFVDVPGHERFIKNMLAGAAGIEAVMLIVAADESVMPQTREHFEICRLLDLKHGFVVLTKIDLASPEQIGVTCEDVQTLCVGSFLDGAPIVQVSSKTGQGLAAVVQQLQRLAGAPRVADTGLVPRLPIDRSFSINGFGTVVTGTLWSGFLRTGDDVLLHPSQKQGRIRGIQVHGVQVETGSAGQRTAINLAGLDSSDICRGDVLTPVEKVENTQTIDAWIEWLDRSEMPAGKREFLFHLGTAELPASVKVLQRPAEGLRAFARLWLAEPALIFPGDRFILRRPSPARTVGGGQVLDAFPPIRLNRAKTLSRLATFASANPAARVELLVEESATGLTLSDLLRLTGLERTRIKDCVLANPHLLFVEQSDLIVTKTWLGEARKRLLDWLADFHRDNPSQAGAPLSQARLDLRPELASVVFDRFSAIRVQSDLVSLANHKAVVSELDQHALAVIESALRAAGCHPPAVNEVLRTASPDPKKARGLLESLIKSKKLVRISEDLVFHSDVIQRVRNAVLSRKGRRFSVPEFKEWTQMSRKYAIPMLEYLDRERVTRRDGDMRVVL
jgi:selenocysteine-specific elongation factor